MRNFTYLIFVMILAASVSACTGWHGKPTTSIDTNNLQLLTYGEPRSTDWANAEHNTASKWGFSYKTVAGCIVTKELVDSVRQHNTLVKLQLCKKYGNEWENEYDKEIEAEYKKEKKAIALLNQKFNLRIDDYNAGRGNRYYHLKPVSENNYSISAEGDTTIYGKERYVKFEEYTVDIKALKAQLLSDKVKPID